MKRSLRAVPKMSGRRPTCSPRRGRPQRKLERQAMGRTLAMKEAISAARQHGVESSLIKEAQQRLEHHQLRQKRAECEKEVSLWFASAAQDLEQCGRLLEAAVQSQCAEEIQAKLRKRLEELKITRPLAPDELDQAQRYVTESCQGFVSAALLAEGRKTLFLDLDEGTGSCPCVCLLFLFFRARWGVDEVGGRITSCHL
eukprot:g30902.t1